ncbi:MAG: fibronectin type III domain-containing protein, partial [Coriobacteriales bacterium]|nr:fibronectin type III domain-containing protein [Coriobacteriales bacterium]
ADEGTALDLTWNANAEPTVTGYRVYRAPSVAGSYQLVATLGLVTSYTDSTVPKNSRPYYKIAAADGSGNLSAQSAHATALAVDNVAPATPALSARDVPFTSGEVALVWSAATASDLSGYNVYRSTSPDGPFESVGTVSKSTTKLVATGLTDETPYYFKVAAFDTSYNESVHSAPAAATPTTSNVPEQRYENTNSAVVFSSGWFLADTWLYGTNTSNGSLHYATVGTSAQPNVSRATFTFQGKYATWIGVKAFNRGIAAVYVDGVLQRNVDCYAPGSTNDDFQWQVPLYTTNLLSEGTHTMEIVYTGTKNPAASGATYAIDVDAFDVYR